MKARRVVLLCSSLALLALAAPAQADVVNLKNGSRLEGDVEEAADGVRVRVASGSVWLPRKEVASIERTPVRRAAPPVVPAPPPLEPAPPPLEPAPPPLVQTPIARVPTADEAQLTTHARAVEAAFQRGDAAGASTLMASGSIRRFDETGDLVDVYAIFDGELSLTVRRNGAAGPIAVAFPPGTYGQPQGSRVQDLTILRAPVLVLPADEDEATVSVSIACATYSANGPSHGQVYALTRFAADSPMDRLMAALCAGPEDPEGAQLAVWIVANGIRPAELRNGHAFGGGRVTASHTSAATQLLLDARLSPDDFAFFNRNVRLRVQAPARIPQLTRITQTLVERVSERPSEPVPVRPRQEVELELLEVPEFPAPVSGPVTP